MKREMVERVIDGIIEGDATPNEFPFVRDLFKIFQKTGRDVDSFAEILGPEFDGMKGRVYTSNLHIEKDDEGWLLVIFRESYRGELEDLEWRLFRFAVENAIVEVDWQNYQFFNGMTPFIDDAPDDEVFVATEEARNFVIVCGVSGGVTGSRTGILRDKDGEVFRMTKEEAETEAKRLREKMNHPNARARYTYDVREAFPLA